MKRFRLEIALTALLFLYGCSSQYYIQRAQKHQQKAIHKGAKLTNKTDTLYLTDTTQTIETIIETINDTVYITNTVYITKTVTKIVKEHGEVRFVTRRDKRYERRLEMKLKRYEHREAMRSTLQKGKTDRTTIRNEGRGRWEWWIIVILVVAFAIYLFITNKKK